MILSSKYDIQKYYFAISDSFNYIICLPIEIYQLIHLFLFEFKVLNFIKTFIKNKDKTIILVIITNNEKYKCKYKSIMHDYDSVIKYMTQSSFINVLIHESINKDCESNHYFITKILNDYINCFNI